MYQDCPVIVTAHPYKLSAYRTDTWQGWDAPTTARARVPASSTRGRYYNLEPRTAAATGGTSSTWIVVIVVVAAAAAVVAFVLVRRGRRAHTEEE